MTTLPRGAFALVFAALSAAAPAELPPLTVPLDRPGERPLPVPEPRPPGPPPEIGVPPADLAPQAPGATPELRVRVHGFRFVGNTAFSDTELGRVVAPYVDRDVDSEDLESVRLALTRYYVEHGYINSGAVVPDQDVAGGVITVRLVEGVLTDIQLTGLRHLSAGYVRRRIALGAGAPLNVYAIRDRLFLLQQDPRIRRLDATLAPGLRPGEAVLRVAVDEAPRARASLALSNHSPPSVGSYRGELEVIDYNLLGFADTVGVRYGLTEGLRDVDITYAVPLNARDTSAQLRYARSHSTVVEAPFDELDVRSEAETLGLAIWHPYLKTPSREYTLGVNLEQRSSASFLFGEPFAFSEGTTDDGRSRVTVLRLAQSWLAHDPGRLLVARSTFSVGLDAWDASIGADEPDARFVAWLGQSQWVEQFAAPRSELVVRADAQLSNDPLLPLEQFPVGGANSVRGYRESQLVRDNGVFASLEYRVALFPRALAPHLLQLAAFADWGSSWNRERDTPDPKNLTSVGLGLRGRHDRWIEYALYWGRPLRDIGNPDTDLQDDGIHFFLRMSLL